MGFLDGLKAKVTGKKDDQKDKKDYAEMEEEKVEAPEKTEAQPKANGQSHEGEQALGQPKQPQQAPQWGLKETDQKRPSTIDQIKSGLQVIGSKANEAKTQVQATMKKVDNHVKNAIVKQKKDLNAWIAVKVDQKVLKMMNDMEPKITASAKDEKMPNFIQQFVEDVIKKCWGDLTELVRFELRIKMEEQHIELSKRPDKFKWLCCWYRMRNHYLYSTMPYDKSIWEIMKTPRFIFWKSLQLIPFYNIQIFAFLLLFVCIDKSEEYQLVHFILNFKTLQFFTAGCFAAISGYFKYFYCATILPSAEAKQDFIDRQSANSTRILQTTQSPYQILDLNYCFSMGPGSGMNLTVSLIAFFSQLLLIWIAYFLLFKSKGATDFIDDKLKVKKGLRGGRLTHFMIYDLICFLGAVLMTALIFYEVYYIPGQPLKLFQEVEGLFYFAKLIYGTLSFPFMIFAIGFFVELFTTAKPTAYDQYGNVVPITSKIKLIYDNLPPLDEDQIDIEEAIEDEKQPPGSK